MGRSHESIAHLQQALAVDPTNRIALLTLGSSLHASGQQAQAVEVYQRMVQLGFGEDANVQFGLGLAYQHLGQILESAHYYSHALDLQPDFVEAALNLAALHHRFGIIEASIQHYHQAADILTRTHSEDINVINMVHNNLGLALMQVGDVPGAIRQYDYVLKALRERMNKAPHGHRLALRDAEMITWSHAFRGRKSVCDWEEWEMRMEDLLRDMDVRLLMHRPIDTLLPFDTLGLPVHQEWRKLIAQAYSAMWDHLAFMLPPPDPPPPKPSPEGKHPGLVVGYLCYDFNNHPTSHMVEGLFIHHRYNVSAYSYGKDDNSTYRRNIESLAGSGFVDLVALGHHEAVGLVRQRGAHIVVDLQGYTLGARSELTALRLAPIQVSYLIYPGTSGSSTTDYLIADHHVIPPERASSGYTERIVYLPFTYQVNYYDRHLGPLHEAYSMHGGVTSSWSEWRDQLRARNHLPPSSEAFIFCNFNKNDKLEPHVFSLWMSILRRVPHSMLWLLQPPRGEAASLTMENVRREAEAHGVSGVRVVFASRVDKAEHLLRHAAADLFLDTFHYGAHSTATDALRGGLPVLTVPGEAFPGRVGVSLLHNMGSHALETGLLMTSMKEYEDTAVTLATGGSQVLEALRAEVQRQASTAPLFDTKRLTRDMERAFEVMWETHLFSQQDGERGEGKEEGRCRNRPCYDLIVGVPV